MPETTAYPLTWPTGWARTPPEQRAGGTQFRYGGGLVTFDRARRLLVVGLNKLRATDLILSTNLPVRGDGYLYADAARRIVTDPGAAVYFSMNERPMVMAQDAYQGVAANVRSLGLAVEAMRQLERHGGGAIMERAFTGFTALPRPRTCWEILDIPPKSDAGTIRMAHKGLVIDNQTAANGSDEKLAMLNRARDDALREIGAR